MILNIGIGTKIVVEIMIWGKTGFSRIFSLCINGPCSCAKMLFCISAPAQVNNLADGAKLPPAIYIHFVSSTKKATSPRETVFRAWSSRSSYDLARMNNLRTTWRGWMGRRWVRQSGRKGRCSYLEPWWTPIRLQPLVPQSSLLLSIIVNIAPFHQLHNCNMWSVWVLGYWFIGFSEIGLEDSNLKSTCI